MEGKRKQLYGQFISKVNQFMTIVEKTSQSNELKELFRKVVEVAMIACEIGREVGREEALENEAD